MIRSRIFSTLAVASLLSIGVPLDANAFSGIKDRVSDFLDNSMDSAVHEILSGKISNRKAKNIFFSHEREFYESMQRIAPVHERVPELMLHMMSAKRPITTLYWDTKKLVGDQLFFQNHELINLQSVGLRNLQIHVERIGGNLVATQNPEKSLPGEIGISEDRMKSGIAPIGPDGLPVLLCRLFSDLDTPYFEMAYTDASAFINESHSGLNVGNACIVGEQASAYWKDRVTDFVTEKGDKNNPAYDLSLEYWK